MHKRQIDRLAVAGDCPAIYAHNEINKMPCSALKSRGIHIHDFLVSLCCGSLGFGNRGGAGKSGKASSLTRRFACKLRLIDRHGRCPEPVHHHHHHHFFIPITLPFSSPRSKTQEEEKEEVYEPSLPPS